MALAEFIPAHQRVTITRKFHFHSAHRNLELVGTKCVGLHGHTYFVEFDIHPYRWPTKNRTVVMSFEDIDAVIEPLIKSLDHAVLVGHDDNELREALHMLVGTSYKLLPYTSSAEHLAQHLYEVVREKLPDLTCVRLMETPSSVITYTGS